MCGIYGYIGKNAVQQVVEGIKRLEYRGYDSAGIAFCGNMKSSAKFDKNIFLLGNNPDKPRSLAKSVTVE